MGSVKIDIYKDDKKYYDTSYSSEEDIYDILWLLDIIFQDAQKGNKEALITLRDLNNLDTKYNPVFDEYCYIQMGFRPMKLEDQGKEIIEVVAKRLNMTKEECERKMLVAVLHIKKTNLNNWYDYINKNYKSHIIAARKKNFVDYLISLPKITLASHDGSNITSESLWQVDYCKKYVVAKHIYKGDTYPEDFQELIELQGKNEILVKALSKNKDKTKNEKTELSKRIKLQKTLQEDINILKDHYRIPRNHYYTESQDVSYKELMYYKKKLPPHEEYIEREYDSTEVLDEWQIEKIKDIANKILTKRQLVVFSLYYESRLTQREIANILTEDQGNIAHDLKRIIKKIKENI